MENIHASVKELTFDEMQIVAGGDKYDALYDEIAQSDAIICSMKCFVISGKRYNRSYEFILRKALNIWGDEVPPEEIEAFVRFIYEM